MTDTIFDKRSTVITSFIVPWILNLGIKTPQQARTYIKNGSTLNPNYYSGNKDEIETQGPDAVYKKFMNILFSDNNIDSELSVIAEEPVYKPWDCLSGIYQYEINETMGLVARPQGITKDNETVIMTDTFLKYFSPDTEAVIEAKMLATMVVWKAKRGIYYIANMDKVVLVNFDEDKWNSILTRIKIWAEM